MTANDELCEEVELSLGTIKDCIDEADLTRLPEKASTGEGGCQDCY